MIIHILINLLLIALLITVSFSLLCTACAFLMIAFSVIRAFFTNPGETLLHKSETVKELYKSLEANDFFMFCMQPFFIVSKFYHWMQEEEAN